MMMGIGLGFLILSACCCDFGSWTAIIGFAVAGLACISIDVAIKQSRKAFKNAVEREVNRKIRHYYSEVQ